MFHVERVSRLTKALLIAPAVFIVFSLFDANPLTSNRDPGFECKNGGLVVIAAEKQTTRAIAEEYCTGDVEKADAELIKRYKGVIIPHWAFINVESLGRRK
jgi:hypothetical protein